MINAGVLNVLVTASTGQANAALRATSTQFKSTAATANTTAASTSAAWKRVGIGLGLIGIAAVKFTTDFNQAMTQIETQAGAPAGEIDRLRDSVLKLARASEFSPKELADGLFRVESAGFRGAQAIEILTKAQDLAAVGQSDLESTTYALTAAMKSGIHGTESAAKTVGTLNAAVGQGNMRMEDLTGALSTGVLPVADAFGLSLGDVTAALDLMTRAGTPAQAAATRLRMTFSLMGAPTDAAKEALKGIGLEQTDLAKAMRGPQGLLGAVTLLKEHLSDLTPVERAQTITAAFGGGRSSSAIIAMVRNVDDLGKIMDSTKAKAGDFGEAVQQQSETTSAQFKTAMNSIEVDLIRVGDSLVGPAAQAVTIFAGAIEGIIAVANALPGPLQAAAGAGTGFALAVAGITFVVYNLIKGLDALLLALTTNPFLAATTAIVALGVGIYSLVSSSDDAASATDQLRESSDAAAEAFGREKDALAELHDFTLTLASARHRSAMAALQVKADERAYHDAVDESGKHSLAAKMAAEQLTGSRIELRQATRAERREEGTLGDTTGKANRAVHGAEQAARGRIRSIKRLRDELHDQARTEKDTNGKTQKYLELHRRVQGLDIKLKNAKQDLNRVTQHEGQVLSDWFKGLRALDGPLKDVNKHVDDHNRKLIDGIRNQVQNNRVVSDARVKLFDLRAPLETAAQKTQDLGREQHNLGGDFHDAQHAGAMSMGLLQRQVNKILVSLGVDKVHFGVQKKQHGGFVVPGHGFGDKVPTHLMLEPGETGFILNRHATSELAALEAANNQWPRMQAGGQFGGMQPGIVRLITTLIARYGGYMSSGYRPGDTDSFHGQGLAADYVPNDWVNAARYVNRIGPSLLEGIYTGAHGGPPVSWDTGQQVPSSFWGSDWAPHSTHIHTAISGMIKGMIESLKRVIVTGPNGQLKGMAQGSADAVFKAANHYIQTHMPTVGAELGFGASGSGMQLMKNISRQRGWNFADWWALDAAETSHGANLINPTSTARLRGQFLQMNWGKYGPGSDPAQHPSMDEQIISMAEYIAERYGNPTTAWAFHQAHGWYKGGGLTEQAKRMAKRLRGAVHNVGAIDERIDVAQRLGGLPGSPGGTDLTVDEIRRQMKLQRELMDRLRFEAQVARHGLGVSSRALDHLGGHSISAIQDQIKHKRAALQAERDRGQGPREKVVQQLTKEIQKLQQDLSKEQTEHSSERSRLSQMRSTFRQALIEMVGLTGRGGRVFDTKLAIKELAATKTPEPLHIDELMRFAEAMRFGAFQHVPAYAAGGLHRGGLALVGERGPEIVNLPDGSMVYPNGHGAGGPIVVEINFADGMGWLKQFTNAQIKGHERDVELRYRSGAVR